MKLLNDVLMTNNIQFQLFEGMIEWNSGLIFLGLEIWGSVIPMRNW